MPYMSLVDDNIEDDECGTAALANHFHNNCITAKNTELGRVRSAGWITQSYLPTIMEAPTDRSIWEAGIASGDVIIIPLTRGTYDPGTPTTEEGYGDQASSNGPSTQVLTFTDPVYFKNAAFYKTVKQQSDRVPFFVTQSILHIADIAATIVPTNPVATEITSQVNWNVSNTWISEEIPTMIDLTTTDFKSTIFDAKYLNNLMAGGGTGGGGTTTYDTELSWIAGDPVTKTAPGVTATIGNADLAKGLKIRFNAIADTEAESKDMTVKIGTDERMLFTFDGEYDTKNFEFEYDGVIYKKGVIAEGNVTVQP